MSILKICSMRFACGAPSLKQRPAKTCARSQNTAYRKTKRPPTWPIHYEPERLIRCMEIESNSRSADVSKVRRSSGFRYVLSFKNSTFVKLCSGVGLTDTKSFVLRSLVGPFGSTSCTLLWSSSKRWCYGNSYTKGNFLMRLSRITSEPGSAKEFPSAASAALR